MTSIDSSTCLELALEGERLCKCGDFSGGVAFFEAAVNVGTTDMKTLSAIYSQLGNAYFYLTNYQKAMEYHKLDLTIAKSIHDLIGEAKASGNLGNTLKMMCRYEEAIMCCKKHLDLSRELTDQVGEGRALYNLGNVYHTKGKSMARVSNQDPGQFPEDVKKCLESAVDYYKRNLELMLKLGDKTAQGRACGNLGNTHYLLGNFTEAVAYHEERLKIAREFGDKAAERRAQCNLGNARIFLGEFEAAVDNYKQTLLLAQEIKDRVVEAQACYSLGNTYTLLRDYNTAIEYHLRHLQIAQELRDRIGEGRACWSLGNAWTAVGDHQQALNYAQKHLEISREIGDINGQTTAQMSISDLRKLLEPNNKNNASSSRFTSDSSQSSEQRPARTKRPSMEHMELMKMTPEQRKHTLQAVDEAASSNTDLHLDTKASTEQTLGAASSSRDFISKSHEDFLELLSNVQSTRMDDQRCALDLNSENKENRKPQPKRSNSLAAPPRMGTNALSQHYNNISNVSRMPHNRDYGFANSSPNNSNSSNNSEQHMSTNSNTSENNNSHTNSNHIGNAGQSSSSSSQDSPDINNYHEDLFDLIAGMQERRMNDQRASLPPLSRNSATNGPESLPGQINRLNYGRNNNNNNNNFNNPPRMRNRNIGPSRQLSLGANVMPDDDFFEMLMRCQASRIEDQRSIMPTTATEKSNATRPSTLSTLERPRSVVSTQSNSPCQVAPTVPDEDFFSLIIRFQAGRIEDQRSVLPERPQSVHLDDEPMKGSSVSSSRKSSTTSTKSNSNNAPSVRKSSKTQN